MAAKALFPLLFISFLSLAELTQQQPQQQTFLSFSLLDSPWRANQNRILVSPNGTFAAGFREVPSTPQLCVFAVWYQNSVDKTVVWTVNGNIPINRSTASLVFSDAGSLILNDSSTGKNLWDGATTKQPNSTKLVMDESGNLMFGEWMSFKNPRDTILPGQTFPVTGIALISRKSPEVYASGSYYFVNSSILALNYSDQYWNSGNNLVFLNLTSEGRLITQGGQLVSTDLGSPNRLRRLTLDVDGNLRIYSLPTPGIGNWTVVWQAIMEVCTIHGTCGPNYVCKSDIFTNAPSCICPPGFQENSQRTICNLKIPLSADPRQSKFIKMDFVNYTGVSNQTNLATRDFSTCESGCLANPRCVGFAYKYDGSQYCVHQIDRLLFGFWSPSRQIRMHLRVSVNESATSNFTGLTTSIDIACPRRIGLPDPPKQSQTTARNLAIICSFFALELIGGVAFFWSFLRKHSKYTSIVHTLGLELLPAGRPKQFTYAELKAATDNFSYMIGEGGFGTVYKGQLPDGRMVAVKCLKTSPRSEAEFWAEVAIIGRMHHLNLVRLWGFCTEKQRMLVYEFVPNGSLDKHMFPAANKSQDRPDQVAGVPEKPMLDWSVRYRIALGVARAIAYLHEECLEWVLHCDIKPENILLEHDFCPKVSDFGLAKLSKKEDMVTMSRMRGTRGYMAPEWLGSEAITAKADVYSFGMVLLELVTGQRNFEQHRRSVASDDWYLPHWVFNKVYKEKNVEEVVDPQLLQSYDNRQHFLMVDRMVKTAMWCLQERTDLRPSMGKVAKMLEGTVEITEPGRPTIFYLADHKGSSMAAA